MPLMPLSYSRLATYEQCPAKFEHLYVRKTVSDTDNEFTLYGSRVHEAMELYGKALVTKDIVDEAKVALEDFPQEVHAFLPLVERVVSKPGTKYFEWKLALNADRQRCEWMDPDVWLRAIIDVLVIDGDVAYCLDWKTGKVRDNSTQLQMFALMVFAVYPEVQEVKSSYVWLTQNDATIMNFHRRQADSMWDTLMRRTKRVQTSVDLGVFEAKPGYMCKWCPARPVCGDAR